MRVRFFLNGNEIGTRYLSSPPAVGDEVTAFTPHVESVTKCRVESRRWLVLEEEERNQEVEIHMIEVPNA